MTTEELTQAQRELEDARREREELDALIAALEEQVRSGEASDAERELAERYSVQKLAQLRQEAAQRRVKEAEAAALAERRRQAEAAAQADLVLVDADVLAEKFAAALAALDDLASACTVRDEATRRHLLAFRELDMADQIVADQPHQQIIEVGGERFEVGTWTAERIVARVVGRVGTFHRLRALAPVAQGFGGAHDLEAAVAGLSLREARDAEAVSTFGALLVSAARGARR